MSWTTQNIVINNSTISYTEFFRHPYLYDYYNFILNQLITYCSNNNVNKSIALGVNSPADIKIGISNEQNIVDNDCQIIEGRYDAVDWVITHTNTNIQIIKNKKPVKQNIVNKSLYIPPIIYQNLIVDDSQRISDVCTIHHQTPKRTQILQNINHTPIINTYDKQQILNEYNKFKILVNVHQDDIHGSLEEIRILPALTSGILVVSEDSLYKEFVLYSKHIIWSQPSQLQETINDVITNYQNYKNTYLKNFDKTSEDLYNIINLEFQKIFS
jgi:hypothetical protein